MTKESLKEYWPDTPEEWHRIATYIRSLGSMLSGTLIFTANDWLALGAVLLTWFGGSVADYFGHKDQKQAE